MALLRWLRQGRREAERAPRTLSWWLVAVYAVLAVGIGGCVIWWTWPPAFDSAVEQTKAEVEAIRTGLAAAGGAGAVFTLLLAVRKQRSTEKMDTATQHDAEERRVTDLYVAAVEQLGHDKAAVRLGGLYALRRLGQNYPEHRGTIVDVWCAYLRMPAPDPDLVSAEERDAHRQDREVRLTVQKLLADHAHRVPEAGQAAHPNYWGDDLDINLEGATLHNLDLSGRVHPRTTFTGAIFVGDTRFGDFTGDISFRNAVFTGPALFKGMFPGHANFSRAKFRSDARYIGVNFASTVEFEYANVVGHVEFEQVRFHKGANFYDFSASGVASFIDSSFGGSAVFDSAQFIDDADFDSVRIEGNAYFGDSCFSGPARFEGSVIKGKAWFHGARFSGAAVFSGAIIGEPAVFDEATFTGAVRFDDTRFCVAVSFDKAVASGSRDHDIWPMGWALREVTDDGGIKWRLEETNPTAETQATVSTQPSD